MAKRDFKIRGQKQSTRTRKTKKRLEIKRQMLALKAAKKHI